MRTSPVSISKQACDMYSAITASVVGLNQFHGVSRSIRPRQFHFHSRAKEQWPSALREEHRPALTSRHLLTVVWRHNREKRKSAPTRSLRVLAAARPATLRD